MISAIRLARKCHKKAIEQLYEDRCTVIQYQSVRDEQTKQTHKQEVVVLTEEACKLSFRSVSKTQDTNNVSEVRQEIKLFLAPHIEIKAGSKILVTRNGNTTAYRSSGVPNMFFTHQEIALELFERWA